MGAGPTILDMGAVQGGDDGGDGGGDKGSCGRADVVDRKRGGNGVRELDDRLRGGCRRPGDELELHIGRSG